MNNRLWVWIGVTIVSVLGAVAIAGIPDSRSTELLADSPLTAVATTTTTTTTTTAATTTVPSSTALVETAPPATEALEAPATEAPVPTDAVPSTEVPPTTIQPLPERADVPVVVANGAAIGGVARATADELIDLGYVDVRTVDGDVVVELTVVFALPGFQDVAARLATDVGVDPLLVFPIGEAPEAPGLDDEPVLLYLGRDIQSLG